MTIDKSAQRESTLLSVIAQAHARGAKHEDVERYVQQLTMESSKRLVEELYDTDNSSLERWAQSLAM